MQRRKFTREFKLEAVRLIRDRGVSVAQASVDLGVHHSQLRDWVKKFAEDPQYAFPGNGQMKPEQLEIARLKREVIKLKAEREVTPTVFVLQCEDCGRLRSTMRASSCPWPHVTTLKMTPSFIRAHG